MQGPKGRRVRKHSLGIGVLTWRAPETLAATLSTYRESGLPDCADDAVVYFQERESTDDALAERYGFRAAGSEANTGILEGMRGVVEALGTEYILSLENDCPVVQSGEALKAQIDGIFADIDAHGIEVFQVRSLRNPGVPFVGIDKYAALWGIDAPLDTTFALKAPTAMRRRTNRLYRMRSLTHRIGFAAWSEQEPERKHAAEIKRSAAGNLITDSRYLPWSNQPFIARRDTLLRVLDYAAAKAPDDPATGFRTVERALKYGWWRDQKVPMGIADPGLFTHLRLDR